MFKDAIRTSLLLLLSINCIIEDVLFDLINQLDKEEDRNE